MSISSQVVSVVSMSVADLEALRVDLMAAREKALDDHYTVPRAELFFIN